MSDETIDDLFVRARTADPSAQRELFDRVYSELHRLARHEMARQRPAHTLQPTALVNEAFVKLRGRDPGHCTDRHHFLRLAGKAMRQILVDHARRRTSSVRTDPDASAELDAVAADYDRSCGGLTNLEAALARLQARDPDLVQLVELRFFAGRSMDEAAAILGISSRSAARRWQVARVFLSAELRR